MDKVILLSKHITNIKVISKAQTAIFLLTKFCLEISLYCNSCYYNKNMINFVYRKNIYKNF